RQRHIHPSSKFADIHHKNHCNDLNNSHFPPSVSVYLASDPQFSVGAVYDRPGSRNRDIAGGHRPPLQAHFPTRRSKSFSFSQTDSINSLSGNNSNGMVTFQGLVYALGSSIVIS